MSRESLLTDGTGLVNTVVGDDPTKRHVISHHTDVHTGRTPDTEGGHGLTTVDTRSGREAEVDIDGSERVPFLDTLPPPDRTAGDRSPLPHVSTFRTPRTDTRLSPGTSLERRKHPTRTVAPVDALAEPGGPGIGLGHIGHVPLLPVFRVSPLLWLPLLLFPFTLATKTTGTVIGRDTPTVLTLLRRTSLGFWSIVTFPFGDGIDTTLTIRSVESLVGVAGKP